MTAALGQPAPLFTLEGIDDADASPRPFRLEDYRGQPVVLVFYMGDNTTVCTRQLNAYSSDIGLFAEVGAQVLAISPQSVQSHIRFADHQGGFAFPLLADEDKTVGRLYGVLGPLGFYRRAAFVVDAEGILRYAHRAMAGLTFRPSQELIDACRIVGDPAA